MLSIVDYSELIKSIPVYDQSARIKRKVWEKILYDDKSRIENTIFGDKEEVELSRADVLSENDTVKKIVMVLMWGYPTGGRGSNIENTLNEIVKLSRFLSKVKDKDLTKADANNLINDFKDIRGLGFSTWSKFLYFFSVTIDSRKCQIFDQKIVDSLNKKQFDELGIQKWKQNIDCYYKYIGLVDDLSKQIDVLPEQVEVFLFYFNLYYKFRYEDTLL